MLTYEDTAKLKATSYLAFNLDAHRVDSEALFITALKMDLTYRKQPDAKLRYL